MTSSRYLLLLLVLLLASLIALAVTAQEPPDPTLTPPLYFIVETSIPDLPTEEKTDFWETPFLPTETATPSLMATETQPPPLNPTLAPTYTYVIAPFPTAIDAPLIAATQSAGYGSGEMGTGESEALSNNGLQPFDAPMSQSAYMLVAARDSAGLVAAINAANAAYEMNPASISTIYLNVDVPYDAPPEQRTYLLDQRFRIEGTVIIHGNNAILRQTLINRVFLIGLGAKVELHHVTLRNR